MTLKAPFPWYGGKSKVAALVWERFGDVQNYVEPFFGSGAVLLGRPGGAGPIETGNDLDGFVCNAWRAIKHDPEATAEWASDPVNECDLHARHLWLKPRREELSLRLMGDPDYYDAKIAGWWLWGMACWIGSGFCGESGSGPWGTVDGQLVHLGDAGQGVARQLVHLSGPQGVTRKHDGLLKWFGALQARLQRMRFCCGDWERVMGPTVTEKHGLAGIFLDPPYSTEADRDMGCYAIDSGDVAHAVREWCLAHGDNPLLRIALCGYAGEGHDLLSEHGWECVPWKTSGGYGSQAKIATRGKENAHRERIWFSPACLKPKQQSLFDLE